MTGDLTNPWTEKLYFKAFFVNLSIAESFPGAAVSARIIVNDINFPTSAYNRPIAGGFPVAPIFLTFWVMCRSELILSDLLKLSENYVIIESVQIRDEGKFEVWKTNYALLLWWWL